MCAQHGTCVRTHACVCPQHACTCATRYVCADARCVCSWTGRRTGSGKQSAPSASVLRAMRRSDVATPRGPQRLCQAWRAPQCVSALPSVFSTCWKYDRILARALSLGHQLLQRARNMSCLLPDTHFCPQAAGDHVSVRASSRSWSGSQGQPCPVPLPPLPHTLPVLVTRCVWGRNRPQFVHGSAVGPQSLFEGWGLPGAYIVGLW